MPKLRAFDLWSVTYTTDAGRTHALFPFRTQQATVGTPGNPASDAVSGPFAYEARDSTAPCVGLNDCVRPRKLICVLPTGETYGVIVPDRDNISTGVQLLVDAGCVCVHLEGETIIDPRNNLIPA